MIAGEGEGEGEGGEGEEERRLIDLLASPQVKRIIVRRSFMLIVRILT